MTKPVKSSQFMREQRLWGWIFLAPWIIGFLVFTAIPLVASIIFSLSEFQLNQPDQVAFVGLKNFKRLFSDPVVKTSLVVTFKFALISLPIGIILPIALAALLNSKNLWGKPIFRTLFYMPYIVPVVSAVFIWQGMLSTETGWINRLLGLAGIAGPDWLNSVTWIYPALVIMGLWGIGNAYLITLAGMQGVPTAYYEAARVDGASGLQRFFNITVPMISPVIFYNLILSVIGLLRYFEVPFILKNGTGYPGTSTMFYNIHFYKTTFVFFDMGYGAALAWLLFIITIILTLILFGTSRYWVYYAGGDR
ncbi:MAG: sugar ABC transporter permease [Deinococcales bacterium]